MSIVAPRSIGFGCLPGNWLLCQLDTGMTRLVTLEQVERKFLTAWIETSFDKTWSCNTVLKLWNYIYNKYITPIIVIKDNKIAWAARKLVFCKCQSLTAILARDKLDNELSSIIHTNSKILELLKDSNLIKILQRISWNRVGIGVPYISWKLSIVQVVF